MTATDRLRAMLDERGVEWEDMSIRPYACTSWRDQDGEPCTALEGADDIPDGKLSAQALLTPEQAIAATLGAGTCVMNCVKMFPEYEDCIFECWECSACKRTNEEQHPHFCPNCGAKVEKVES